MRFGLFMTCLGLCALTACGGGGGGDGSNSSPVVTPASACSFSNTHSLVAVALDGSAGTAQFSGGGATLTYSGGLSGSLNLVKDSQAGSPLNLACLDASGNSSSMRTDMQSNGNLGVSHVMISGTDYPVFLMDSTALASNTNIAAMQGTYIMLRYQQDSGSTPAQTRMSYVTVTIDNAGNWSMCKNAPTCSPATATGTFAAHPGSSYAFDFSSGGLVRGTSYVIGTGANRVLVNAEYDTGGGGVVKGIHFGIPQTAWNPNNGSYVLNTSDGVVNEVSVTALNVFAGNQNHSLTVNTPITGLATATANGTINYLLASPAGLLVTGNNTANNFANGPGYLSFGVTP